MAAIEINFEDNEISVTNLSNKRNTPAVLTSAEISATKIVESALQEINVPPSEICYRRHTEKYLSVITHEVYDFLRIKAGEKAAWFTVFLSPEFQQSLMADPRFEAQKNKRQLHWKVTLGSIDELVYHKDLIQHGYQSALWSYEKTRQMK